MSGKLLRGLAYAALAALILVASCDALLERDELEGLERLRPGVASEPVGR